MIQLNLLPDVKLEYIKAERTRRLVLSISSIVTIVAIAIFVLLYSVDLLQKHHLSTVSKSINSEISQLQNEPNINKILTIQNQLGSLTALQSSKPAANNLFSYLNEVTPSTVNITNLTADFNQHTLLITGTATNLNSVNQYVDTIKLTTYVNKEGSGNPAKAFSNVVLSSFATSTQTLNSSAYPASYTISLDFDPSLFTITNSITLQVPNVTTTRLEQINPTNLFAAAPASTQASTSTGGTQ